MNTATSQSRVQANHAYPGVFISFEGGEGVGKSTHISFLEQTLTDLGFEVIRVREPGSTPIGEALRQVVLDAKNTELDDRAELLVYEAARAQLTSQVIVPHLRAGHVVLCDRFIDSTCAYQGYGRGLALSDIHVLNDFATSGLMPDATILLTPPNASVEQGLAQATEHTEADRMEGAGLDFHLRVHAGFDKLAARFPERICRIACQETKADTARMILEALSPVFGWGALPVDESYIARVNEMHGPKHQES